MMYILDQKYIYMISFESCLIILVMVIAFTVYLLGILRINWSWWSMQESQSVNGSSRKTVVLDLDETLIHISVSPQRFGWFGRVKCVPKNVIFGNQFVKVYVYMRPDLEWFLETLHRKYDIDIFTAGEKSYAEPIIDMIDPNGYIRRRFYRNSCTRGTGRIMYFKDLKALGYNLEDVVIVDNCESGIHLNKDNGILIHSWTGSPWDTELRKVMWILEKLLVMPDIRSHLMHFVELGNLAIEN